MTVEQLYEQQIKYLSYAEQLQLVARITQELAELPVPIERPQYSLLELEGVGAELWQGINAQEYVNELRREWDHRP